MARYYGSETKAIVLCPHCEGRGCCIWPQSQNQNQKCSTCFGKGRVVRTETIKYEKLPEKIEPLTKWMKGM